MLVREEPEMSECLISFFLCLKEENTWYDKELRLIDAHSNAVGPPMIDGVVGAVIMVVATTSLLTRLSWPSVHLMRPVDIL